MRWCWWLSGGVAVAALLTGGLRAQQAPDPAYAPLAKAYDALRVRDYDAAIASFERAVAIAPQRASIRKDLAYTLLKIGENEAARDQFAAAMRIDPADTHVALEYAFLAYETKQQRDARRIFDRLRKTGNATAEQAFQNVDRPLADGIARWQKALESTPDNFSAHQELAMLAEQRDELALAAEHYEKAWRLKPGERELLLDLGRMWKEMGRGEQAMAALMAASRGAQPRVAEKARELLPARYPYVYEFQAALQLDPDNVELRRELAYLFLQMGRRSEAEEQFRVLHQLAPKDLLSTAQLGFLMVNRGDALNARPLLDEVLHGGDEELADRVRTELKLPQTLKRRGENSRNKVLDEARELAEKSLKAGYMKDALKYLTVIHENDPLDFGVMLKLGWAYNSLHDDREAIRWFDLARSSPDDKVSSEASRAYHNLKPAFQRFRTTAWFFPFYSTRWHDTFGYAQIKTEWNTPWPVHFYVSTRFVGDTRRTLGSSSGVAPQYLSEDAAIFGIGAATRPKHGLFGWFEAGESVKYLPNRTDVGTAVPDYRGGLSYAKGFGHLLGGAHGFFTETNEDAIYVSRFQNDFLTYAQGRSGYTFAQTETGGFQAQLLWNYNITFDRERQYWANFAETGPGIRFRSAAISRALVFNVNFMRGAYLINEGNPRRPNFFDLRAGFWYAFTR